MVNLEIKVIKRGVAIEIHCFNHGGRDDHDDLD